MVLPWIHWLPIVASFVVVFILVMQDVISIFKANGVNKYEFSGTFD
jgi:hypothetical protein